MKKLIRKSVFETNSLSSHSLSFKYEREGTAIYESLDNRIRDGVVWIDCDACKFYDNHSFTAETAYEKIALLATLWNSDAVCLDGCYDLHTLEKIVSKNTGCEKVYFHGMELLCFLWEDDLDDFAIFKDFDELYDFVFNPKRSIVVKYNTY